MRLVILKVRNPLLNTVYSGPLYVIACSPGCGIDQPCLINLSPESQLKFLHYSPCQISLWRAFFHCCNKARYGLCQLCPSLETQTQNGFRSHHHQTINGGKDYLFLTGSLELKIFLTSVPGRFSHIGLESFLNYHCYNQAFCRIRRYEN